MARSTSKLILRPSTQTVGEWTKNGEGLVNSFAGQEESETTPVPTEANNLSVAATKKIATGALSVTERVGGGSTSLAEGEIPISVTLHLFAESLATEDILVTAAGTTMTSGASKVKRWRKSVVAPIEGKTLAELIATGWSIESTKAVGGVIYAIYVVLETETERSNILTGAGAPFFTGAASVGGVVEMNAVIAPGFPLGSTVSIVVAGIASGATSVSDPRSNTYTKDYEHAFTGVTVQFWSAKVTTEIKNGDIITLSGFTSLTKVTANVDCMFGLQSGIGATAVDVTVTVEGTGESFEAVTPSTRATQGDVLRCCFVALGEATSLSFTGSTPEVTKDPGGVQKEAGLSMLGGWAKKPPEGSASTVKGKWNTSLTYAGVVVQYKVLATPAAGGNILAMIV